jgi:LytS/YehU family sensor histidine kinase
MISPFPYPISQVYMDTPIDGAGWIYLLLLSFSMMIIVIKLCKTHKFDFREKRNLFIVLSLLTPFVVLFFGVQLPETYSNPPTLVPIEVSSPYLMVFSDVPWVIAGILLGPLPALIMGGTSGLARAFLETHQFYSIVEGLFFSSLFCLLTGARNSQKSVFTFLQPLVW